MQNQLILAELIWALIYERHGVGFACRTENVSSFIQKTDLICSDRQESLSTAAGIREGIQNQLFDRNPHYRPCGSSQICWGFIQHCKLNSS